MDKLVYVYIANILFSFYEQTLRNTDPRGFLNEGNPNEHKLEPWSDLINNKLIRIWNMNTIENCLFTFYILDLQLRDTELLDISLLHRYKVVSRFLKIVSLPESESSLSGTFQVSYRNSI